MSYAVTQPRLMPTKRSKRYVAWRTSQRPAGKYNRKVKPEIVKAETRIVIADRFLAVENAETLHNCNECGRSGFTTHEKWRILHNH